MYKNINNNIWIKIYGWTVLEPENIDRLPKPPTYISFGLGTCCFSVPEVGSSCTARVVPIASLFLVEEALAVGVDVGVEDGCPFVVDKNVFWAVDWDILTVVGIVDDATVVVGRAAVVVCNVVKVCRRVVVGTVDEGKDVADCNVVVFTVATFVVAVPGGFVVSVAAKVVTGFAAFVVTVK